MEVSTATTGNSRTLDVNAVRLKYFIQHLSENKATKETVQESLKELPREHQEICRLLDSSVWIPIDVEHFIIQRLSEKFNYWEGFLSVGKECLMPVLVHILPANPWMRTAENVIAGLPSFISLFLTNLYTYIEMDDTPNTFSLHVEYRLGSKPSAIDLLFIQGMIGGLMEFIRTEMSDLYLAESVLDASQWPIEPDPRTKWSQSRNIFRVATDNLSRELSAGTNQDQRVDAQRQFVRQVLARSSQLLQDKRELVTAVEYLNLANNELEKQIRANKKELYMAANIQAGMIPSRIPDWEGLQFWTQYSPLQEVSGDLYDFFPLPGNRLALLVCDVSGHGVPAALISAIAKLSFNMHKVHMPSDVFSNVNLDLLSFVKREGYLTAFYMIIDADYKVVYSIAAVPSPLLYRASTGEVERLKGSGTLIGMFPDAGELYMNQQTYLEPGDKLFIFTDGLNESINTKGEQFGEGRIAQAIAETKGLDVQESISHVLARHREFILGTEMHDDLTIVALMVSEQKREFNALMLKARRLYRRKKLAEACETLRTAIGIFHRHPEALYLLGKYLAMNGRYDEAEETLTRFIELKPYDHNGYTILAHCLFKRGYYERAEQELRKSLSLRSDNPSALYNLVKVQKKLNKIGEAKNTMAALEYLKPYDPRVKALGQE